MSKLSLDPEARLAYVPGVRARLVCRTRFNDPLDRMNARSSRDSAEPLSRRSVEVIAQGSSVAAAISPTG
jgi:hypothetical protein